MQVAPDPVPVLEHRQPTAVLLGARDLKGKRGLLGDACTPNPSDSKDTTCVGYLACTSGKCADKPALVCQ